ncbi:MAG: hypothetical protein M1828_007584 [Chrysothrix sp. TS-e1954]|nr:MAG: hypothetical protein M1828_007584 [Chrysothrix sp. TS-e1954]
MARLAYLEDSDEGKTTRPLARGTVTLEETIANKAHQSTGSRHGEHDTKERWSTRSYDTALSEKIDQNSSKSVKGMARTQRSLRTARPNTLLLPLETANNARVIARPKQSSRCSRFGNMTDISNERRSLSSSHRDGRVGTPTDHLSAVSRVANDRQCCVEEPASTSDIDKRTQNRKDIIHVGLGALAKESVAPLDTPETRPTTSSSCGNEAVLHFSPPHKMLPVVSSVGNHPSTPVKLRGTKGKLTSPKKTPFRVPSECRPRISADSDFWNAEAVNAWTDARSPSKTLTSPRKTGFYDILDDDSLSSDAKAYPDTCEWSRMPKKTRDKAQLRRTFEATKHEAAASFLQDLDDKVTNGELAHLTKETGGIQLVWSKKLNSTAGRANWRREAIDETSSTADGAQSTRKYRHVASIELASKVITSPRRLYNVVAHEYCHLCNFMISNERGAPHGISFKRWASLTTNVFRERDVEVTTKHNYQIEYRYRWTCSGAPDLESSSGPATNQSSGCGAEYSRHSRSIDPQKHLCGRCKGRLTQVRPAPRKQPCVKQGDGVRATGTNTYQHFVKQHFAAVKAELGGKQSPSKDVMREIASRYRSSKRRNAVQPMSMIETAQPFDDRGDTSIKLAKEVAGVTDSLDRLSFK